mgnify:CR=1 FL=1
MKFKKENAKAKLQCWSLKFIICVQLIPQISTEHNWSFKIKKWVVLVILLTAISSVIYVTNKIITWNFLMTWHFLIKKLQKFTNQYQIKTSIESYFIHKPTIQGKKKITNPPREREGERVKKPKHWPLRRLKH